MSSGVYDDLFRTKAWIDGIKPSTREWVDGLVDHILEVGREPLWADVYRHLLQMGDAPGTEETARVSIRRLVAARG